MKTKYIKVSVSGRLPEKEGWYCTLNSNEELQVWKWRENYRWDGIEFWLEEVPDREDEMRDVLEKIYNIDNKEFNPDFNFDDLKRKIKRLLTN